ncbi:Retrovirus-related Pol polyprotein from transposon RE1 [Vitis vinifera]|uniref:Retrovirus-related Pol polyprotein from transposon RE1 n=1 Tax=Vitis vinifera TaxID=29760 RepID=A0A438CY68_VITVI|nr:Retrovirus-related Pol polyprotein from transposon RE1 [Vitis vinifera]
MDVSLESKSLSSVGYSRKSYLQTTYQKLARDKLVHLHGRRSLALPSVGSANGYSRRAAKLAFILRFSASNLSHISGNFRRKSTTLYKKAAKSLRNKRVISQHFAKCFLQLGVISLKWTSGSAPKVQKKTAAAVLYFLHSVFPLSVVLSLHTLNDFGKGLWSSKAWFFMNLSFQKLCHELYTALPHSWIALHDGELNFLLGLQIKQLKEGTFINQAKYMKDLLKRFNMEEAKTIKTPMSSSIKLDKDEKGKPIDSTMYRGMIGSLLYLTANRPDIIYLKGTMDIGLWYPKGDNFELTRFSNANFAGCKVERKNTSGTCHFLGHLLVSWHSKKQSSVALSMMKVEYIAADLRETKTSRALGKRPAEPSQPDQMEAHQKTSSGSQKSNASNGVQFGVETKKLQPLQANHSELKEAFCKVLRNHPFVAK